MYKMITKEIICPICKSVMGDVINIHNKLIIYCQNCMDNVGDHYMTINSRDNYEIKFVIFYIENFYIDYDVEKNTIPILKNFKRTLISTIPANNQLQNQLKKLISLFEVLS